MSEWLASWAELIMNGMNENQPGGEGEGGRALTGTARRGGKRKLCLLSFFFMIPDTVLNMREKKKLDITLKKKNRLG